MKKASVIIPLYNAERYIAETLKSVLEQSYDNFEVLIVDDGSSDSSVDICNSFNDPKIVIIQQQNKGLPGARNTGIRHARGSYVAFLDADDLWRSEKLEKHIAHLESSPTVGVSFSYSELIDENGNSLGAYQHTSVKTVSSSDLIRSNLIGNGSNAVIRREVFESVACHYILQDSDPVLQDSDPGNYFFDEYLTQKNADSTDLDLWLRISIQTDWQLQCLPEVLTFYRLNTNSLSANLYPQLLSWEKVIEKAKTYAPELVNQYGRCGKALTLRYLAGKAIRFGDGRTAVDLINRSVDAYWRIVLEYPKYMFSAIFAAYCLYFLPSQIHEKLESFAIKRLKGLRKSQFMVKDEAV